MCRCRLFISRLNIHGNCLGGLRHRRCVQNRRNLGGFVIRLAAFFGFLSNSDLVVMCPVMMRDLAVMLGLVVVLAVMLDMMPCNGLGFSDSITVIFTRLRNQRIASQHADQ